MNCGEYLKQIGMSIRKHRRQFKIALPTLAKRAKISQGNLSKIENTKGNLTVATLFKIAAGLDVPVKDLLP